MRESEKSLVQSPPAIDVRNLRKTYGSLRAVDDISFTVSEGDFFAFLGPNGAGKTTTINAIISLATMTRGSIAIFGHDIVHDWRAARRLVGISPQDLVFDPFLSIRDVLIYQAGYYGVPRRIAAPRADELLDRFELTAKAQETCKNLSGGMLRRLSLARALIHDPKLLILDEPTAGIDVELRLELWAYMRRLNADGVTILLTTHYLEEVEQLCRTIAVIESGRIVTIEPTSTFLQRAGQGRLSITVDREINQLPTDLLAFGATIDTHARNLAHFIGLPASALLSVFAAFDREGYRIIDADLRRASVHDAFLDLVGK